MESRKYFWFILVACLVSLAATLFQLFVVYMMSLVGVPGVHDEFRSLVAGSSDLAALKQACTGLIDIDEVESKGRVQLMVVAPLVALLTAGVCAIAAGWALLKTRKPA